MVWTVTTPKVAVNCGLFDDHGRLLLIRRKDNDLWAMPGGFVDLGEQIADAVRREVREETGLTIEVTRLVGVYSHPRDSLYIHLGPEFQVVVLLFRGRILSGEFEENPETHGFEFFDPRALPKIVATHQQRIQDLLADAPEVFIR
jgi:ADP-ribose pyrophosphatase YjhB (NUDIX family)